MSRRAPSDRAGLLLYHGHRTRARRAAFLQHYGVSLPDTAFFYLPHHGSHENWKADAAVLAADPICPVSAGLRSKYGHPHLDVIDELENKFLLPEF